MVGLHMAELLYV